MPFTAFPGIPFGGYKQSGFGRELSIDTLDLYLETKGVLVSTSAKPFIRSASSALALERRRQARARRVLVFAVARQDLPQFHGKSMTGRAVGIRSLPSSSPRCGGSSDAAGASRIPTQSTFSLSCHF